MSKKHNFREEYFHRKINSWKNESREKQIQRRMISAKIKKNQRNLGGFFLFVQTLVFVLPL